MTQARPPERSSPWRRVFEEVRRSAAGTRDEDGIRGSINWLRKRMAARGANPNVVRNIIYRDKGRPEDKRVLYEILSELWQAGGNAPLQVPEIDVLLSARNGAEGEHLQILGREKRNAYRGFVEGVRAGARPRLLVTGRPGSGKTLLLDYIQEALELASLEEKRIVRVEFTAGHLASRLSRLAAAIGVPPDVVEAKLAKVGTSGAYAVQADAQAEIARILLEAARAAGERLVFLFHVSRAGAADERLGGAPLRLNTPEVPRVTSPEWLWASFLEPLSRTPGAGLLVSMTDLPARALADPGGYGPPLRLSPPTINDARKFVRARLPHLDARQQEDLVRQAGRSYEELRTLTLLAEVREPIASRREKGEEASVRNLSRLAALVDDSADEALRDFLATVAVLSLPEFPEFSLAALGGVRKHGDGPSTVELAFLDPVPQRPDHYRPFSRTFTALLRDRVWATGATGVAELHARAAGHYRPEAVAEPDGEAAGRYLLHSLQARDWRAIGDWLERYEVEQPYMRPLWDTALAELDDRGELERIAHRVASHYTRLAAHEHPDAIRAFDVLAASSSSELRAWAAVRRAEGAVARGQVEEAESRLQQIPETDDPIIEVETALVEASIARWRSSPAEAAALIGSVAAPAVWERLGAGRENRIARSKVLVWAGLIAKDRGDLEGALAEFGRVDHDDELVQARVAFQRGDVLLELGRFDAALAAFDRAVTLAGRNHVLTFEQTRYLARRATLRRRRGELDAARADFEASRSLIESARDFGNELERAFWLGRSCEEEALSMLAERRYDEAILVMESNIATFEEYSRRFRVAAHYRMMRSTLRLALAYFHRALGQPLLLPLLRSVDEVVAGPDLRHARTLHGAVSKELESRTGERFSWLLRRDVHILGSLLAEDPRAGLRHAEVALEGARYPYQRARSLAYLAHVARRAGDGALAGAAVDEAVTALRSVRSEAEGSDPGLASWLAVLRIESLLEAGHPGEAGRELATVLTDERLSRRHDALVRAFGDAVERTGCTEALEVPELAPLLGSGAPAAGARVRLSDHLSARRARLAGRTPSEAA